jgi:tritrans,polycis-undecaprenyl-diphosphate synthase [geranylgeranyl-diphosphate specific]
LKSSLGRRILTAFYQSSLYHFISDKVNDFRNLKLKEEIKRDIVPEHIAIIMDGNRRFADALGLPLEQGHFFGKDRIENVLDWCFELGVKVLTVYAFSTENFNRSNSEVQTLMQLCNTELYRAQKDSRIHKNKVRVRVIGQLDALPMDIRESATNIMDLTEKYDKYYFNIALAYGGRGKLFRL